MSNNTTKTESRQDLRERLADLTLEITKHKSKAAKAENERKRVLNRLIGGRK
jgi:hypothetical protein